MPIGEIDFQPTPCGWAEDYSYWNNTDRPETVTARQWAARARTWEQVCLNDHNGRRLNHVVVNAAREEGLIEVIRALGIMGDKSYGVLP